MNLSFNEMEALEREMEENPGRRYRVIHFQIKEMSEAFGFWSFVFTMLMSMQVVMLGLVLWRVW